MKKIILSILLLFSINCLVFAEENKTTENTQLIEVEEAGGIVLFQKQPVYDKQVQIIKIKQGGGMWLIQINGKIKDSDSSKK